MSTQHLVAITILFSSLLNASSSQHIFSMTGRPNSHANSLSFQHKIDKKLESNNLDLTLDSPKRPDGTQEDSFTQDFLNLPLSQEGHAAMLTYLARSKRVIDETHFPEGLTCDICEFLVREVRSLVQAEQTVEELLAGIAEACSVTGIVRREICRMVVHEYQDQIVYIFDHLLLEPDEVCGLILGDGCATPYFPGHMWKIPLPPTPKPPPKAPKVPKPDAPKLRVLQLTDIHLDPEYEQGTKAECRDPLCCRKTSYRENFLDVLNIRRPLASDRAGRFGSYNHCDCPMATATDMFKYLRSIQDQYDYIMFTGDIPPHDVWNQTQGDQKASIRRLDHLFKTYLPNKPLYQAVGNHESAPCNSFPPLGIPNHNSSWLFDTLVDVWGRWVPRPHLSTVAKCGMYSISPYPGFRIISVNNNYCNKLNFWLLLNATDPCGGLQWLIQELQAAEDKDEKVHLMLHIPPGSASCLKAWSWNFYMIVSRYENTIVNQFYGHDHKDYFQVFLDDREFQRPLGVGFAAPSVTPYSGTNPTFRIYTIDGNYKGSSWAVLDFTTYYLNITEANMSGKVNWKPAYSAKKDLEMNGLYPKDWENLIDRMETDDVLFQKFYSYFQALHTERPCRGNCKSDLLCRLREGRSSDPKLCDKKRRGH